MTYLEYIRRELGYSQQRFAAACGVSKDTLRKLEKGGIGYKPERLHELVWRLTYRLRQFDWFSRKFDYYPGRDLTDRINSRPNYFWTHMDRRHKDPSVRISPSWCGRQIRGLWFRASLEDGSTVAILDYWITTLAGNATTSVWALAHSLPRTETRGIVRTRPGLERWQYPSQSERGSNDDHAA